MHGSSAPLPSPPRPTRLRRLDLLPDLGFAFCVFFRERALRQASDAKCGARGVPRGLGPLVRTKQHQPTHTSGLGCFFRQSTDRSSRAVYVRGFRPKGPEKEDDVSVRGARLAVTGAKQPPRRPVHLAAIPQERTRRNHHPLSPPVSYGSQTNHHTHHHHHRRSLARSTPPGESFQGCSLPAPGRAPR